MVEKNTSHASPLEKKWGENTLALGWTAVPTALLFLQAELRISSVAMNVLLNLVMHWWGEKDSPFPAQEAIAKRIGVSKRTVQRAMGELEKLKIIKRTSTSRENQQFRGRNLYDLSPLAGLLNTMTPALVDRFSKKKARSTKKAE